jgi:choline kinase
MSNSFQFKNSIAKYTINDVNGGIFKEYSVDVGNEETLKAVLSKIATLEKKAKAIGENPTAESIDGIRDLSKDIIESVLGNFDEIYNYANKNVFAMIGLTKSLADFINENLDQAFKEYV